MQPVSAQLAPTPSPLEYCPFHVSVVTPLDHTPHVSQSYAVALESEFPQGNAAGTLVLYSGNDRYEAAFDDVTAPVRGDSPNGATPIVVQFPRPVRVDAVYVGAVSSPIAGYCSAGNVWLADAPLAAAAFVHYDHASFTKAAGSATANLANLVERESNPDCDHPNEPARPAGDSPISSSAALADAIQKNVAPITIAIAVALTPGGEVVATKVLVSKTTHAAEVRALQAASGAMYAPQRFRCKAVVSTYLFTSSSSSP